MKYHFDAEKHLHTLDGVPLTGTSSVVGVLKKPLTWWASGKALELLGWTPTKSAKKERAKASGAILTSLQGIDPDAYQALLDRAYRNHKDSLDKSAVAGTDLHAELQTYIERVMHGAVNPTIGLGPRINPFVLWATENVKSFIFSEANCYSEKLWTGGIADAGAELKDGRKALIDFKSAKGAYASHFIQCAGYTTAIEENGIFNADGKPLPYDDSSPFDCIIVVPFGADPVVPVEAPNAVSVYRDGFAASVVLYRILGLDKEV